ncbi:bifunctional glutamate N-acetyltransferase/amino-acid acetyltransferase ArgJ [Magnetospirillum moscoviense]|uniref:Arginine biosynthesis bifunctional protein ArgJ n=1 Tax=Magnetospirillum moscoviense TaxID=1437059 RepID=A0A178M4P1_9PROT|nr:bifunctional glutamate N-acetyltransferase/amino-acid acetyltransferase ArgJ [Magnetospirillum moscoviense]MBF0324162.1 bifunctional glutamate N-acetyltransferase/amino-acid acetyltransferase ArgJ [Alphaproteobacteria bacterium]OAN43719.1 bifunctional ornithine acetyltransferase/N-acetylglutamate synthase [Magnetospirillum moscoviense]
MSDAVSPLAPAQFPSLPPLAGIRLASHACGIRYQGRTDLLVVEMAPGTAVAGVYTRSLTRSAPVDWCRQAQIGGRARVLIVNSGNANAFTGKAGIASVERTVAGAVKTFGCAENEVFVASTGTIGVTLPDDKITAVLDQVKPKLADDCWAEAARAIMTTDTFPKGATRTARIDGITVTINGFAKGAGMIAPDMATMLSYVFTDAALPADLLQTLLSKGVEGSFNAITVDSDTSTSDTLMLFATGQAKHAPVTDPADPRLKDFRAKLFDLLKDLAHQVVKDGEGATKFVEVTVTGAASTRAAKRIALSIANSPLVKTAIAGEDANWGRVVMAVGKSGEKADRDKLSIRIGGIEVAHDGEVVPGYDEAPVTAHMKGSHIVIETDVGVGRSKATVWTCDLTHAYIDINGSYRT